LPAPAEQWIVYGSRGLQELALLVDSHRRQQAMLPSSLLKRIDDLHDNRRSTNGHDWTHPAPGIDDSENPETAPI